jgi:hypothetical protein
MWLRDRHIALPQVNSNSTSGSMGKRRLKDCRCRLATRLKNASLLRPLGLKLKLFRTSSR